MLHSFVISVSPFCVLVTRLSSRRPPGWPAFRGIVRGAAARNAARLREMSVSQPLSWLIRRRYNNVLTATFQIKSEGQAMPNFDVDDAVAQLSQLTEEIRESLLQRKTSIAMIRWPLGFRTQLD